MAAGRDPEAIRWSSSVLVQGEANAEARVAAQVVELGREVDRHGRLEAVLQNGGHAAHGVDLVPINDGDDG